ncbi:hypothetical protein GUJ93_ZPchr0013g37285 [Zizania palustris]|uniref:Uncharacterized protein n=1 Tax=Zizania palustris TaxID=103762 RepID=A0A8J6BU28_ZIZPA|nr:hypothetical protein GUJ93_ZPchr0013g37285 [Zizania palustris]
MDKKLRSHLGEKPSRTRRSLGPHETRKMRSKRQEKDASQARASTPIHGGHAICQHGAPEGGGDGDPSEQAGACGCWIDLGKAPEWKWLLCHTITALNFRLQL